MMRDAEYLIQYICIIAGGILLILLDQPPCPYGMQIVGGWCYTPYTESKETIYSIPYLVNYDTLYFFFCCLCPGVFLY